MITMDRCFFFVFIDRLAKNIPVVDELNDKNNEMIMN